MNAPVDPSEVFQVSAQQASILDAQQARGTILGAQLIMTFDAPIDRQRLEQAAIGLSERHEILRTEYRNMPGMKRPVQVIHAQPRLCLLSVAPGSFEQAGPACLAQLASHSLVLGLGSGEDAHRLRVAAPLASLDEVALGLLEEQLRALYQGQSLAPFDGLQYADYADWQTGLAQEEIGRKGGEFWRNLYRDMQGDSRLPYERLTPFMGALQQHEQHLPAVVPALRTLRQQWRLDSDAASLLLLWGLFVGRLSGREHWLVACAMSGRNEQLHSTLGHLAWRLPVAFNRQAELSVDGYAEHFAVQLQLSQSWQDCFNELDMLGGQGAGLDFGFSWADQPLEGALLDRPSLEKLHLQVAPSGDDLLLRLLSPAGSFSAELGRAWLAQFAEFVTQAVADPRQAAQKVALVDAAQARPLQQALDRSQSLGESASRQLHQLFERHAQQHPERTAIQIGEQQVSYAQLERRANQLARVLNQRGIGREAIVGVYGARSVEIIVALLAILKAGAAYLPLDPQYPAQRLSFMLEDAGVECLIALQALDPAIAMPATTTLLSLDDEALDQVDDSPLASCGEADDLAYVIYTSGSTGTPKGVMVSHANALASTQARVQFYQQPVQRFLMLSSFSFDSSVAGIFWSLGQGGSLCLPLEQAHKDPQAIAQLIERQAISHFLALPSLHAQVLEHLQAAPALRCAIVAGEVCPPELLRRHRQALPGVTLVNEYGPSESTVWCCAYQVAPEDRVDHELRVAIGEPIAGTRLYVLDDQQRWAGVAQEGELYVAGAGLSRGYLNRPGLTASRFVPDPFASEPGQRCYRTGDLACVRADGLVDYLGRLDHQLKIRGHRIELGEIEALLGSQEGVREAVAIARDTAAGKQLVAYVVLAAMADAQSRTVQLLGLLREQLPEYMVPSTLQAVQSLPRTPNGKLDRAALAARALDGVAYVAPGNELEQLLAEVWQEALQLERVGINDNFFALGGHSLLATRIRSQVQARLNVTLPLKVFFEGETVELLARQIEMHRDEAVSEDKVQALEALFAEAQEQ
ncbi:amino acid adenylation domain-containing protein [Pseudomonas vranovensis]|uniref:Carrier domain-containing protein n=1 Tax=Pseudomonas vranovensis TaxID=321661 RepID=A0A423DU66_9PSED|nr:amino acid adenylation domain-containing protein [Pseudomonas vranovensis]ROL75559.1 hypothetical protein BHU25_09155 [Pseudomonas vranovensis]